jgi:acyl phosphate:glycerol-3-phosphate acyltransferase
VAADLGVAVLLGYLLGSAPLERLLGDRDPAFLVVGNALKGLIAGILGWLLADVGGAYAGVAGAMIGHALPLFANFRGTAPILPFAGGAFAISPLPAAIALAVCGAVTIAAGFTWGARAGVVAFPLIQLLFAPPGRVAGTICLIALVALHLAWTGSFSGPSTGQSAKGVP